MRMRGAQVGLVVLAVGVIRLFGRRNPVKPSSPPQQPTDDAIAVACDARRYLIERAKSRLIVQLVFLPFFVLSIGLISWSFGNPGKGVPLFAPQRWMSEVQRQLEGAITPEMSRNWAIAALVLSVTMCVALASRNQASSTILGQAAVGLWKQYLDGMNLLLSCVIATVAAAGWLSVADRSDIGTMVLTTFATIAIVVLSSIPNEDSNPVSRWWRVAQLQDDRAKLMAWRSKIVEKGVPDIAHGSRSSVFGDYASRTLVVAVAVSIVTAICVPIVRAAEGLPVIDSSIWSLFAPVLFVPFYTVCIGRSAITFWSNYRAKHWRFYFGAWVPLFATLWAILSAFIIVAATIERGIAFGAFSAFHLVGVPAALALLLRLSRTSLDRTSWICRFSRWMAYPIWLRVRRKLDRMDRLIEAEIAFAYEARWHVSPDEIGLA